jgi:hypothetical protein
VLALFYSYYLKGVESTGGLVEEEEGRVGDEFHPYTHTLALPATHATHALVACGMHIHRHTETQTGIRTDRRTNGQTDEWW